MPASQTSAATGDSHQQRTIVVLPGRASEALSEQADGRWLAAANFRSLPPTMPMLERLLAEVGLPAPQAGRAALRWWGQTGERPAGWVAAADPVWMQAGLEKVFVHVPPASEIEGDSLQAMFADLQRALFDDDLYTLESNGVQGYLRGKAPLVTAELPATAIDRSRPDAFMPDINDAAARDYYALCSEIEMTLHDHPFNQRREQRGQRPLNALWLWGGGMIQPTEPCAMPPVFTDDALLTGYCHLSDSRCEAWPGSLGTCIDRAPHGFIATFECTDSMRLPDVMTDVRLLWKRRRLPRVTLLFDDVAIDLERGFKNLFRRGGKKQLRMYTRDD